MLVTERMRPLRVGGQHVHQIGLPYHWGANGLSTGDSANELLGVVLDPNVHIQETKVADLRHPAGPPPRGPRAARVRRGLPAPGRDRAGRAPAPRTHRSRRHDA